MTTSQIERLLRETFTDHAEAAMNQTDTQHELDVFEAAAEGHRMRPRPILALTGLAAAAVVIAGAVLWGGPTTEEPAPAPPEPTRAERVAADFLAAYDADDRATLRSLLAEDADIVTSFAGFGGVEGLMRSSRWDEALGTRVVSADCLEFGTSASGGTQVSCTQTVHSAGSEDLGRGPWTGDVMLVIVEADRITEYSLTEMNNRKGFAEEMGDPLNAWLEANHSGDLDVMWAVEEPTADPDTVRRAFELWERHLEDYRAAVQAGEAD